ncbi:cell division protein FtsQ/DivIB [Actinomyces qiguomingii]|uniref:cell division protein FtsQ/DivIB n=1 Tax=Actinomyces qiguomingii TaxID=2057800 RepID=UPI000C9FFC7B|nr:cell division protein FtsQ/DivIB [Actinomyces qiguomingii]
MMRKPSVPRRRDAEALPPTTASGGRTPDASASVTAVGAASGTPGRAGNGPGDGHEANERALSVPGDHRERAVSTSLSDRIDERRRARRRLRRGWILRIGAVAVAVALVVWAALFSPLLALRTSSITVTGADDTVDAVAVQETLSEHAGRSLLSLDVASLGQEVADSLVRVKAAEVARSWPHGLEVRLTMRVPVAVRPTDNGYQVLDDEAVVLETVEQAPADLAVIKTDPGRELSQAQVSAVTEVIGSLSADVRERVSEGAVSDTARVTLTLDNGATVVWGEATDSELKAQVLAVLLGQEADTYDVSSPHSPTTS